jgi:hypothetical protein
MAGGKFEADGGDAGFEDRGFGGGGTHERLSYPYDVFLSHSAKDKSVVRELAERLRTEGLSVWFDEWEIQGGHSIPERLACRTRVSC